MKSGFLVAPIAVLISACASTDSNVTAEGETARVAGTESVAASGGDTVICKTHVVTATRVGKQRTCRTKDEWARLEENARNTAEGIQRQGSMEGSQVIVPSGN